MKCWTNGSNHSKLAEGKKRRWLKKKKEKAVKGTDIKKAKGINGLERLVWTGKEEFLSWIKEMVYCMWSI